MPGPSSPLQLSNLDIVTYDTAGNTTSLGSLKDANVINHSPIYNVHDQESGFLNQADSGAALAWLTADNCPLNRYNGQAAFTYDAFEGGSVNSVSASYGALSVSTSGSPLELQKSTQPFAFVY
ncbi:hypothetical protein [Cryobacterium sp. 10C2]|uniref:hypothetical protein n=1 Tax=Cryobacterium sp. 10C2 TaxID=3048576 RepID=UPI002AB36C62|nr:hypothetical protein [Cryobacterium sp. 10C2]MDY7530053.1 hypothetical protein [Cryobacterium sp. 10C2]MEB0290608.1 hypothetical protein [Cryobacterium sp. 10C2]